jgi:drug/metabolite transporter (DMT)-like permease
MKKVYKGIIFVGVGAALYGILAAIVKLAGQDQSIRPEGYTTAEVTFAQALVGVVILLILNAFLRMSKNKPASPNKKEKLSLMFGGIPLGLTSTFLYLSLQYISVSVSMVLLMQSVWLGTIFDYFINKQKPTTNKLIAIGIVLVGTLLATNVLQEDVTLNWTGVFWGFMSGLSFTWSMYTSDRIAPQYSPVVRSLYMVIGSLIIVTLIWGYSLLQTFDVSVLWKWGIVVALFGTVLPPIFFTKGFPMTGLGLGSIIASVELPVSVLAANIMLSEEVNVMQWGGIFLIIAAVVLMNISFSKKAK